MYNILYIGIGVGRVCECDAAEVVPAPDILLFDGRVLHAKLTYRILVQLVQATARYLLSRILYYIIITRISMCVCVLFISARRRRGGGLTPELAFTGTLPVQHERRTAAAHGKTSLLRTGIDRLEMSRPIASVCRLQQNRPRTQTVRPRSLRQQYYIMVLVYNIL